MESEASHERPARGVVEYLWRPTLQIRVATWNAGQFRDKNNNSKYVGLVNKKIKAILRADDTKVDFLTLQEYEPNEGVHFDDTEYHVHDFRKDHVHQFITYHTVLHIVHHKKWSVIRSHGYAYADGRGYCYAIFDNGWARVCVCNVWRSHDGNKLQLRLPKKVDACIIAGDFNPPYDRGAKRLEEVTKHIDLAGWTHACSTVKNTTATLGPHIFDAVIRSNHLEETMVQTLDTRLSDHHALLCDLTEKKCVGFDYDGVLHTHVSYTSGRGHPWKMNPPTKVNPRMLSIFEACKHLNVKRVINTHNPNGAKWFCETFGLDPDEIIRGNKGEIVKKKGCAIMFDDSTEVLTQQLSGLPGCRVYRCTPSPGDDGMLIDLWEK